jgi:hypothetical protein
LVCSTAIVEAVYGEGGDGVGQPVPDDLYDETGPGVTLREEATAKCAQVGVPPFFIDRLFQIIEAGRYDGLGYLGTIVVVSGRCADGAADWAEQEDCLFCRTAIVEAVYSEGGE